MGTNRSPRQIQRVNLSPVRAVAPATEAASSTGQDDMLDRRECISKEVSGTQPLPPGLAAINTTLSA
jgi:hypothetical protein